MEGPEEGEDPHQDEGVDEDQLAMCMQVYNFVLMMSIDPVRGRASGVHAGRGGGPGYLDWGRVGERRIVVVLLQALAGMGGAVPVGALLDPHPSLLTLPSLPLPPPPFSAQALAISVFHNRMQETVAGVGQRQPAGPALPATAPNPSKARAASS
jgi:hypothetical protein